MANDMKSVLKGFYDISSYGEWCDDDDGEDGYYCKEFIDSLHEILDEMIEVLNDLLGYEEADPDTLFEEISTTLGIDDYSELYWEIMDTKLEIKYGRVQAYENINGYDLAVRVEDMLSTFASIEIDEEDFDEED